MILYLRTLSLVDDFSPGTIVRRTLGMDVGLTVAGLLKSNSQIDDNELFREGK